MLVFICIGLLSAVYANDLKYQFVGEFYDPTPLPHSVWDKFKHHESTLFPHVPNRNLPGVRLPSPRVVFPHQSNTYAAFYNQNRRVYNDGPGSFGSVGGHGGYNYAGYSGRGDLSYGYDGYSGHHDNGYDGHGVGFRYGVGSGHGYGSAYNSAGRGYDDRYGVDSGYGGGYTDGYGVGDGHGGGYGEGHGVSHGYDFNQESSRVIVAPWLAEHMRNVRKEDLIGQEFDGPHGGKIRVMGMSSIRMADGRGATLMRVEVHRPHKGY